MYVRSVFVFVRCVLVYSGGIAFLSQRKGIVGKIEGKRLRSDSNIVGKVVKEGKRSCGDGDGDSDSVELGL